jgi:hypothetical protein
VRLVYDSRVRRLGLATFLILAGAWLALAAGAQEGELAKPDSPKADPKYDGTFSGSIVELAATKITVSRSILGKPAERRTFLITPDTRIEGKLHLKLKVTVGFVTSDDGPDVARLIVVRQKPPDKK